MPYDPERHHRQSHRLTGFDYGSEGAYFITICVETRECVLGEVDGDSVILSEPGEAVTSAWDEIPTRFPTVTLDVSQVMPNHFHGILFIHPDQDHGALTLHTAAEREVSTRIEGRKDGVGALLAAPKPTHRSGAEGQGAASSAPTTVYLGKIMRAFKSISGIAANKLLGRAGVPFWQRDYYDRIIRDEDELERIREYILNNPLQWSTDRENPDNINPPENPNQSDPFP